MCKRPVPIYEDGWCLELHRTSVHKMINRPKGQAQLVTDDLSSPLYFGTIAAIPHVARYFLSRLITPLNRCYPPLEGACTQTYLCDTPFCYASTAQYEKYVCWASQQIISNDEEDGLETQSQQM